MALFADLSVGIADPLLARAVALAERGRGRTSPNPMVGCVVARDGTVVGEGFHERAGGPHAEVVALDAAGELARGSHVYVTLEPCNHIGRTPPCVDRLLESGVAAVTIGMPDPNSAVSGGGAARLAAAGVEIRWAPDPAPFERQNEAWLKRLRTGLPFVTAKIALSLDGKPTLRPGSRSCISGPGGRAVTMHLRDRASAVAVGARTFAIDDPALTVRDCDDVPTSRQPIRAVLCRTSVPDAGARMFVDGAGPCLVLVARETDVSTAVALEAHGVRLLRYGDGEGFAQMLTALAEVGVNDVLIEAGPSLLGALWKAEAVDELVVITAGGMGGTDAPGVEVSADVSEDDLRPRMRAIHSAVVDGDAVAVWRPM